jgi:hypothetical protein
LKHLVKDPAHQAAAGAPVVEVQHAAQERQLRRARRKVGRFPEASDQPDDGREGGDGDQGCLESI